MLEFGRKFLAKKEHVLLLDIICNVRNEAFFKKADPFSGIDWALLLQESKDQKVFPLVYNLVCQVAPEEWQVEYSKHQEEIDIYLKELSLITQVAKAENLTIVLQKGFAVSKLVYNDLYARQVGDLDFIIRETDVEKADALLRNLGYLPACGLKNYWEIVDDNDYRYLPFPLLKDDNHHEFYGYFKNISSGNLTKTLEVELGRYLHKTVRSPHIMSFIESSRNIVLDNFECATFDLEHTFLGLCENLYDDAEEWYSDKPSLKNCVDVFLFIEKYPQLDWEHVKQSAIHYDMFVEVQTILKYLSAIFESKTLAQVAGLFSDEFASAKRYRIDWLTDFKTRLFLDYNSRAKELVSITRSRCFSTKNINFTDPYRVKYGQFGSPSPVPNNKNYDLSYNIAHASDQLIFKIRIGEDLYSQLDNHEVALFLVDNDANNNEQLVKYYVAFKSIDGILAVQEDSGMSIRVFHKTNEVEVAFPFHMLPTEVCSNGTRMVGYGIAIKHEILDSVYHWVTLNPYEKEFWNHPPILEIV